VVEVSLDGTHSIQIVSDETGSRAEPMTLVGESWERSVAGDGAGLAVLHRLRNRMAVEEGFRVTPGSWVGVDDETERAMGVDQTHASWVVGERVVVKWMTEELVGPHPAADRLRRLAEAGFAESPALAGVIEWREPGSGDWVPLVVVQAYLPGTEDGWTWALAEARRALGIEAGPAADFGAALGDIVGRMHLALVDDPVLVLTADLARRQADEARDALAVTLSHLEAHDPVAHALLVEHRDRIEAELAHLDAAAGSPALPLHGDLHVGQVLRNAVGEYAVVDFDGNPTSTPGLRAAPAPAARDVAQLLVSLENVEHVVRHYDPDLSHEAGLAWTARQQGGFLEGYVHALGDRGDLYAADLVPAYEWEQVCREYLYAIRHDFLEWLYVPGALVRRRLSPER
jgi:maltokinase